MTVDDKIIFAEYFLDKIRDAKNRDDFLPNLGAFLSETRSIADYLLEDYNLKFDLGISLTKKLDHRIFKEKACDKTNLEALKFISSYNSEYNKLSQNPIGKLLIDKRNITVHRRGEQVRGNFVREIVETVPIHDSVAIEVRDKDGNLKMKSDSRDMNENLKTKENNSTNKGADSVKWYFEDYIAKDVVGVCEDFLNLMKKFVNDL